MKPHQQKPHRCAIYTRKSTEHNLDLAFNSLDAQREACEAYIKSQAHEGWRLVPGHFDDGGLSGASLDRPALQRLLDEIRARRIDIIVVYKVDRLTRSLADFAKLVELFDAHGVSFVSVTQSFNTTSSMGRLTLNVLLSFAQFEREVIGERVRDKIAASKRKGLWVGGPLPLGYGSRDKVLFVVPQEAAAVRTIFERYLALKSVGALAADLRSLGITSRGGGFFGVGALAHLLRNRFYVGEVVYRGEVHRGAQEPIVERAVFQAVQDGLDAQTTLHRARLATSSALLVGRLYDDRGNRLTPSHASKNGLRHRYYVSQAVLQNRKDAAGSVTRIAAPDLEEAVVGALRSTIGSLPELSDRELVDAHVRSMVVGAGTVTMEIYENSMAVGGLGPSEFAESEGDEEDATERPVRLHSIAWAPRQVRRAKSQHDDGRSCLSDVARGQLLLAIGKARHWMRDVAADIRSFEDIAREEGCGERHVRFLAPLAFVSPTIVTTIAEGRAPAGLTVTSLVRSLPLEWAGQEVLILRKDQRTDQAYQDRSCRR